MKAELDPMFLELGVCCVGRKHANYMNSNFQGKSLVVDALSSCFFIFKEWLLFQLGAY